MSIRNTALLLAFIIGCPILSFASTFVVDFDPDAPAKTNGWDLSRSSEQAKSSQLPAGRKLTDNEEESPYITSPVYTNRIRNIAISFKGSGVGKENEAKLVLSGREKESDAYRNIFTLVGIPGTLTNLTATTIENELEAFDCRQLKITYTKNPKGTLVIATVSITDDAIRAETPTDVQIISTDAEQKSATVCWNLAEGLTASEYQTFTVTMVGGIDESTPIWRESFNNVPAKAAAGQVDAKRLQEWGLSGWEFTGNVYQKIAGALIVGGEDSGQDGELSSPPLGVNAVAGDYLLLRAQTCKKKTGCLPIYKISGTTTNLIENISLTDESSLFSILLPTNLAETDRLLFKSSSTWADHRVLIDDIAICEARTFKPETISTNDFSEIQTITTNAVSLAVPDGNTNLYFQVRTIHDGEKSEWSEPILVSLSPDGASDGKTDAGDGDKESGGESGGGDASGEAVKITAPGNPRVGSLPDGKFRIGWETPDGATNVHLKIWTLSKSGGISEVSSDDILWRETFADAPATNTTVRIDNANKFDLYTDKKSDGWNASQGIQVWLSTDEKSIRIGTGDNPGALESNPLNLREDNLTLVVTAKRGSEDENSGVILHAAILSNSGMTTNEIGTAAMTENYSEYSFAISDALIGTEKLLLMSEISSPKDGRIILDDISFVKNYKQITMVTNEFISVDFPTEEEYDFSPNADMVYYAALCAQDANGETSEWTKTLELDPAKIDPWKDHHLTLDKHGKASATLDIAKIYDVSKTKLDVSDEPFRFLIDDAERLEISNNKNVEKATSSGIYVCTNVFEHNWIVLVPMSTKSKSEIKEAEMRIAVETENFAAQKISITGTFAQLGTKNAEPNALLFQWRWIAKDGAETDWIDFGSYATQYTASDMSPDLEATIETVTAETMLRLPEEKTKAPAGARIEVRVLAQRREGEQMAPLGFYGVTISAEKAPSALILIIQ